MSAFIAAGLLVIGIATWIALASMWRLRHEPPPEELSALLARQGVDWGGLAAAAALNEFAFALRRCAGCRARAQCREWLASGRREGYEAFCENGAFVERVKSAALR